MMACPIGLSLAGRLDFLPYGSCVQLATETRTFDTSYEHMKNV